MIVISKLKNQFVTLSLCNNLLSTDTFCTIWGGLCNNCNN